MKIRSSVVAFVAGVVAAVSAIARADVNGPNWNWSYYSYWGYGYTATYGQTFRGDNQSLTGARFRMHREACCYSWPFRWMVMEWDDSAGRAKGPVLAQADSTWSNYGCCWFDRTINFNQRPVLLSSKTYVLILTVSPWWSNYCCIWSEMAINPDDSYAGGSFWYLNNGSDLNALTTQSWSRPGYDLNFTIYTTPDCDSNGIADSTELSAATDCNADQVLDRCQQRTPGSTVRASQPQGPIGAAATASFEFTGLVPPAGDVTLQINASADVSATHEFLFVRVGSSFERLIFTGAEQDCTTLSASVTVPRADFEAAMSSNAVLVNISGSPTVDAAACNGQSWATVSFSYANQWPDCNGNLVGDMQDFCNGTSADCNGNFNPDECDIASAASRDLDANAQPDECQPDCNNDQRPDAWQIATGEVPDCNGNGTPDSCDLATQQAQDCNSNGVPDTCDIAAGTSPDCDGDGTIDSCALAQNAVPDCNANGVPDSCDIASGTSADCNGNGKPDSCDLVAPITIVTPYQIPFYSSYPLEYAVQQPARAASDVRLDIDFYGYSYGYYGQYFRPQVDNYDYGAWYDHYWGGWSSGVHATIFPRDYWNAAAADGTLTLRVRQDSGNYSGSSYCRVTVSYTPEPSARDCNNNGIPDTCDLSSGFEHDCNSNGLPDSCDIAAGAEDKSGNGYPDQCDLDRGDLNLDGFVDGIDLSYILTFWGGINYPIGDLNHDGIIDGGDLGIILANWGPAF